jgi:hypothetical protein
MGGIGGEAGPERVDYRGRSFIIDSPTPLPPGAFVTPISGPVNTGGSNGAIGKQVNNYLNVTTTVADPLAVAMQVINRAAALAH